MHFPVLNPYNWWYWGMKRHSEYSLRISFCFRKSYLQESERHSGNTGQTHRSVRLCWEPSYTRTHSSLPCSKYKQTKRLGYEDCLWILILSSYVINIRDFSFLCQDTSMAESKKCCNSSKNKLVLYQTQNRGPN